MSLLTPDMMNIKQSHQKYKQTKHFNASDPKHTNAYVDEENFVASCTVVGLYNFYDVDVDEDYYLFVQRLEQKELTHSNRKIKYFIQHNMPRIIRLNNHQNLIKIINGLKKAGYLNSQFQIPSHKIK